MRKLNKVINVSLSILIIVLVAGTYLTDGMVGVYAWLGILFLAPIIGIILLVLSSIFIIYKLVKKEKVREISTTCILAIILSSPILILMNCIVIPYPSNIEKATPSLTVSWPFNGETVVGSGGNSIESNKAHIMIPAERWAYDLVMEPYEVGSEVLEEYGIYNKEVLAPISGTIAEAYDEEDDIKANSEEYKSTLGNYIYLKIEETGTYLFLGHFKKGSLTVKSGDHVKAGQVLGRVGNSGTSSEPHLHIHHQKQGPDEIIHPIVAEGLPLYFKDINGGEMPIKGEKIYKLHQ